MDNLCKIVAELCSAHLDKYPLAQAVDMLKLLHQGEFGPGHLIVDAAANRKYLENEYAQVSAASSKPAAGNYLEHIGFGFVRLHIHAIDEIGLPIDEYQRLFELSAADVHGTQQGFLDKTAALKASGLPIVAKDAKEIDDFLEKWLAAGGPPFRHSEVFRAAYAPAYRVMKADLVVDL